MKNHRSDFEKDLVAEQPGFGLSVTGLLIALLLGSLFRGVFSQERVTHLVEQAAMRVHKDISFKIQTAQLSLASGGWPRLSVVVGGVSVQSDKKCWMMPSLEVDSLELPISVGALFRGRLQANEILINQASLTLASARQPCLEEPKNISPTPALGFAELKRSQESTISDKGQLREIRIKKLTVHYLPVTFTSFTIDNFDLLVEDLQAQKIRLRGDLQLGGETLAGEYFSKARMDFAFDDNQEDELRGTVRGNWREGQYELNVKYSTSRNLGDLRWKAEHVPLSQLVPIMRKYRWIQIDPVLEQVWMSGQGRLTMTAKGEQALQIEKLIIDGDLGELKIYNLETGFDSRAKGPINITVTSLALDKLVRVFGVRELPPALGRLGQFSGALVLRPDQKLSVQGTLSGTEFIFSNKGIRQAQTVGLIALKGDLDDRGWKVQIGDIRPVEGIFLGSVEIEADRQWEKFEAKILIDELSLGSAVQKLMTNSGSLGSWSGKLKLNFLQGKLLTMKGKISASKVWIENLQIPKVEIQVASPLEQNFQFDIKMKSLEVSRNSALANVLNPVVSGLWENEVLQAKLLSGHFSYLKNGFDWKNLSAQVGHHHLSAQGGWRSGGDIFGSITLSGPKGGKWKLVGTRDRPQFLMERK